MRDCPLRDSAGGAAQPTGSVAGSSSPSVAMRPMGRGTPAPTGRGRGRGGASSSGGPSNRLYALTSRQDPEAAPSADPGILLIFSREICVWIDLYSIILRDFLLLGVGKSKVIQPNRTI